MENSKKQLGGTRDCDWVSLYIRDDDSMDGKACTAMGKEIVAEWRAMPEEERSIRRVAKIMGQPRDRIRRLIHKLPGLADKLGFTLDSKKRLTL